MHQLSAWTRRRPTAASRVPRTRPRSFLPVAGRIAIVIAILFGLLQLFIVANHEDESMIQGEVVERNVNSHIAVTVSLSSSRTLANDEDEEHIPEHVSALQRFKQAVFGTFVGTHPPTYICNELPPPPLTRDVAELWLHSNATLVRFPALDPHVSVGLHDHLELIVCLSAMADMLNKTVQVPESFHSAIALLQNLTLPLSLISPTSSPTPININNTATPTTNTTPTPHPIPEITWTFPSAMLPTTHHMVFPRPSISVTTCRKSFHCIPPSPAFDSYFSTRWQNMMTHIVPSTLPTPHESFLATFRTCGFIVLLINFHPTPAPSTMSPTLLTSSNNSLIIDNSSITVTSNDTCTTSDCTLDAIATMRDFPLVVLSNDPVRASSLTNVHPNAIMLPQESNVVNLLAIISRSRGIIWQVASHNNSMDHDLASLMRALSVPVPVLLTNQPSASGFLSCCGGGGHATAIHSFREAVQAFIRHDDDTPPPTPPHFTSASVTTPQCGNDISYNVDQDTEWFKRKYHIITLPESHSDLNTITCAAVVAHALKKTVMIAGNMLPFQSPRIIKYDPASQTNKKIPILRVDDNWDASRQPTWSNCTSAFYCLKTMLDSQGSNTQAINTMVEFTSSLAHVAKTFEIDLVTLSHRDAALIRTFHTVGYVVVFVQGPMVDTHRDCTLKVLTLLRDFPILVLGQDAVTVSNVVKYLEDDAGHPNVKPLSVPPQHHQQRDADSSLLRDMAIILRSRGLVVFGETSASSHRIISLVFPALVRTLPVFITSTTFTLPVELENTVKHPMIYLSLCMGSDTAITASTMKFYDQVSKWIIVPPVLKRDDIHNNNEVTCPAEHFYNRPEHASWLQPQHRVVRFVRDLPTGLGDRLTVLLCAAAAAHSLGKVVMTSWYERETHAVYLRYPFNIVDKYFTFPAALKFNNRYQDTIKYVPTATIWHIPEDYFARKEQSAKSAGDLYLPSNYGLDSVFCAHTYWCLLDLNDGDFATTTFYEAHRAVGKEFQVNLELLSPIDLGLINTYKCGYVVLHVRLNDKNSEMGRFCTIDAVSSLRDFPIILVSDEPSRALELVQAAKHPNIRTLVGLPGPIRAIERNTMTALRDMGIMFHARGIIQHSKDGWSAYSVFPALAKHIPMLTTWSESSGMYGAMNRRTGGINLPKELLSCGGDGIASEQARIDIAVKQFRHVVVHGWGEEDE